MSPSRSADVIEFVETLAAPDLAEEWDNVGLLLGHAEAPLRAVMTCLTLTPDVAREAIDREAGLIITHHPILFRAVKRLTGDTPEGQMLLELIRAGVAVYSPHTAFDNGKAGINQWIAEQLGLTNIGPLRRLGGENAGGNAVENAGLSEAGAGRFGEFARPVSWTEFQNIIEIHLKIGQYQYVEGDNRAIQRIGVACGAAAEFLRDAHHGDCQVFLTGEARFHACLEARQLGIRMILLGHYPSERPALEMLASRIAEAFPQLNVWASKVESDPISWSFPRE